MSLTREQLEQNIFECEGRKFINMMDEEIFLVSPDKNIKLEIPSSGLDLTINYIDISIDPKGLNENLSLCTRDEDEYNTIKLFLADHPEVIILGTGFDCIAYRDIIKGLKKLREDSFEYFKLDDYECYLSKPKDNVNLCAVDMLYCNLENHRICGTISEELINLLFNAFKFLQTNETVKELEKIVEEFRKGN